MRGTRSGVTADRGTSISGQQRLRKHAEAQLQRLLEVRDLAVHLVARRLQGPLELREPFDHLCLGERGGFDLGGHRPQLVVDGAAVDVDVRHVRVVVRHTRRLVRARLAAAPRPPRLTAHTPGRLPDFSFSFHRPN